MMNKVILVFKTHFDIGFTDLAEKVLEWYSGPMLDDVLKTCADTADMGAQRFIWTMPAMPLCEMLKRNTGEKYRQLSELVKTGRIVWHALPFTSHTDFCGVEEMIRSFACSEQLCREFKLPRPITAKMSDVPGHGRLLPTILNKAGIRFLHLGCNEFAMQPDLPPLFYWEGPDGSRVLTMYSPAGYGAERPPADWRYPVWISFQHTHDNIGPQTAESLRAIVREVQAEAPGAEVVSGTLEDFYQEIIRCDLSGLPVIRDDLADSWIHGVGSYPAEVSAVRASRNRIVELEAVLALLEAAEASDCADIAAVYEQLSRFGEHTWGLDVKTWLPAAVRVYEKQEFIKAKATAPYRYMEESWMEQRGYAKRAGQMLEQLEERVRERARNGVMRQCGGTVTAVEGSGSGGAKAAVSGNGSGATAAVSGNGSGVTAAADADSSSSPAIVNVNGSSFTGWAENREANGEGMELFGSRYLYVKDVPALSISPLPCSADTDDRRVLNQMTVRTEEGKLLAQNHRYQITVCTENGQVELVYDRKLQRPLLAASGAAGVFAYRYDKYGSDSVEQFLTDYCYIPSDWGTKDNGREAYPKCERECFYPVFSGWEVKADSLILSYCGQRAGLYGDAGEIKLILTLPPSGDELFVELRLTAKQESPYIESGSILFPFAGKKPCYQFNKNGGLIDPEAEIHDGANHALYCLEAFAAMSEENAGVCIIAHDTPLTAIGETGIYTYRKRYERHEPVLYFNLFNNMWGTNFPQWTGGDLSFRYTVFGFETGEPVMEKGLKLYQGASVMALPAADNPLILPADVQVLAYLPDSSGGVLRLRDIGGRPRDMELICRKSGGGLQECDFYGQPLTAVSDDCLRIQSSSYDIRTIRYIRPELKKDGPAAARW